MASTGDVKAGAAYVEVSAKDNTKGGLDGIGKRLKALGGLAASALKGLAIGGVAGVGVLGLIAQKTAAVGDDLRKSADEMGVTVEELGALRGFTAFQAKGAAGMSEQFERVQATATRLIVTLGSAVLPVVEKLGNVFTDVAEAAASFVEITGPIKTSLSALGLSGTGLGNTLERVSTSWQGVIDAITAGDLGDAVKIAGLRVQIEWTRITSNIEDIWIKMLDRLGDSTDDLVANSWLLRQLNDVKPETNEQRQSRNKAALNERVRLARVTGEEVRKLEGQVGALTEQAGKRAAEVRQARDIERAAGVGGAVAKVAAAAAGAALREAPAKIADVVRGAFGGAGALRGQLGGGSLAERGVKAQEKVAANTERLIQIALAKGAAFV